MGCFKLRLLALAAVCLCKPLHADQGLFIQHRSQHPVTALFGLPAASTRSVQSSFQFSIEHSNVFMGGGSTDEALFLDGESTQFHLRYSQPLSACWQADAALVYLAYSGGFLDQPIEDWHQFFGFPDAERHLIETDQLNLVYQQNGTNVRSLRTNEAGMGDLRFSVQRFLGCDRGAPVVRVGVKLSSAKQNEFFGSGANDVYIDWQSSTYRWRNRIDSAFSLGVLAPGEADNLPDQRAIVWFGVLGAEFRWSKTASIVAQLDWHSPLFDSELEELGNIAGQLTLAARKTLKRGGQIELSFAEDIVTDTAPDFSVRLGWRFGLGF